MSLAKPLCAQLSNESLPSLEEGRRAPSVNQSIKSAIPPPSPPQSPVPFSSTSETRSTGTYPIIMMMIMNVLAAIKKSGANAIKQIVILLV